MGIIEIIIGLFALGVLVTVHEWGHFIVAKKIGVKVYTFSIGFGKKLIRKKIWDTEYCISLIPFGGYVHMKGENPDDQDDSGKPSPEDFSARSIPERIAIVSAGPIINLIFAFLILWLVYMVGVHSQGDQLHVSYIKPGSPAEMGGLKQNDRLVKIDDKKMIEWEDVVYSIIPNKDVDLDFEIERDGETMHLTITPEEDEKENMGDIGILYANPILPIVHTLYDSMPAAIAGVRLSDTIVQIDSTPIDLFNEISPHVQVAEGRSIILVVKRGELVLSVTVTPEYNEEQKRYVLGIMGERTMVRDMPIVRYGPIDAMGMAFKQCVKYTLMIFDFVGYLVQRKLSVSTMGGPVSIVHMLAIYSTVAFDKLVFIVAMISINLAIINLVPFLIISDGGHIFFFLLEWVRKKPLTRKTQMKLQRGAFYVVILLFLLVTFNDFTRLFRWFSG